MDVVEMQARIAALEARLAEEIQARQGLAEEVDLLRAVIDEMPVGVIVEDTSGRYRMYNAHMRAIAGEPGSRGVFVSDGVSPAPPEREPTRRALGGEVVDNLESLLAATDEEGRGTWISQSSRPLRDANGVVRAAVTVTRDVTEHKDILRELDDAILASDDEKRALIDQLEAGIDALSTPIIEVWDDVLALPVIGAVDDRRGAEITSRLLDAVVSRGSRFVIIDWTGVDTMDTNSARHLLDLVRAVELVGAECILTGIRPAVAVSLLHLDVRFEHLRLLRNVRYGLRHCFARLGRRAVMPGRGAG
ncbi:STAS domain-containing protein [Polyangium sp. 15x6]|uniref:STAS domain-containing protein n=1 Tax=Polyangium sp. 15x6 TaxID=3042687 RepID=UPI00249B4B71|nr:STAS domain-containing protein [Polyangium sp. 15x6]MDI3285384.1 PAS domain-containing protein [Polyangium sp. 15x6]